VGGHDACCAESTVTTVILFSLAAEEFFLGVETKRKKKRAVVSHDSFPMKTLFPGVIIAQAASEEKRVFGPLIGDSCGCAIEHTSSWLEEEKQKRNAPDRR